MRRGGSEYEQRGNQQQSVKKAVVTVSLAQ